MLTEVRAAGCTFQVTIADGRRVAPRNLLDMDLRDEGESGRIWTILLERGTVGPGAAGWSGSSDRREFRGDGFRVEFADRTARTSHDPSHPGRAYAAAQFAVLGALRREGRAELHASAVAPAGSTDALVLVAESGHGKSTLTLRALASGWGFLSDDLIAVFADPGGDLSLAPLRRTLRVAEPAVPLLPVYARAGQWNRETPRKMIVDPEGSGLGPRLSRARPRRLIFLERGGSTRVVRAISSAEAFERLLRHSPQLAYDPDARNALVALRRLADQAPASVASLPLDSLHDVATLEDLLA